MSDWPGTSLACQKRSPSRNRLRAASARLRNIKASAERCRESSWYRLHGLLARAIVRRAGQIGVCAAVGAKPSGVVRMALGESLALTLAGVVIGLLVALFRSPHPAHADVRCHRNRLEHSPRPSLRSRMSGWALASFQQGVQPPWIRSSQSARNNAQSGKLYLSHTCSQTAWVRGIRSGSERIKNVEAIRQGYGVTREADGAPVTWPRRK